MIKRSISSHLLDLQQKYPVLAITGPRQSGKTKLSKALFPNHQYLNLENLDVLQLAQSDPRSFLKTGSGEKMIIDEVQKCPELLSYLQVEVDVQNIDGQFVITGSQNFSLQEGITQSLAGRVANFVLLPLSYREVDVSDYSHEFIDERQSILRGFYPRSLVKQIKPSDFYSDYVSTYVERDVRQIKNIGDLALFQKLLLLVAGRVGQLINYSSLANDVGVSVKTIQSWLSVLEASYLIFSLKPFHRNFGKRVIKSPKIYFCDTGLLCFLLKINTAAQLSQHYAYGQIFENFVVAEVLKNTLHHRKNQELYFYRDSSGLEIDLLIDAEGEQQAVEIKSAQTYSSGMMQALTSWRQLAHQKECITALVYTGEHEQQAQTHQLLNWRSFFSGLNE